MGRRKKDDGTEAAAFLVFMVLLAPVYIVIEIIKGIILFINARKLAEQNNVLLWDRIKLQDLIENYKKQLNN